MALNFSLLLVDFAFEILGRALVGMDISIILIFGRFDLLQLLTFLLHRYLQFLNELDDILVFILLLLIFVLEFLDL